VSIVLSTGVDIEEINRIAVLRPAVRQRFVQRILNAMEQERKPITDQRLIGLFCAKEAVSKALGCGIGLISWHEITILPDEASKPVVSLSGNALQKAQEQGISNWSISISHSAQYAVAMAVGYGER
jgi:holo-[acyl-carrier protein] synthase